MKNEEYLRAKRFRQQEAFDALYRDKTPAVRVEGKWQLHDFAADHVGASEPLTYLEFGVHKGDSLLHWASRLQHADTCLVGFDSFHGLPETWEFYHGSMKAGSFSTEGRLPRTDDKRVSFVKGWFQNTVPDFLAAHPPAVPLDRQVVIHFDADLYSSTLFLLCMLWNTIPDYHFIMDDFSHDEMLALLDFSKSFPVDLTWIADMPNGVGYPVKTFGRMRRTKLVI
jgi:hypothetical protein